MAIDLTTAGVSLQYAVEATAGTRPTTGYTKMTGLKSIPEINPEPASQEVTTLDDTEWRRYIPGLKDPGGAVQFTANNNEQFHTDWAAMYEAYTTAKAAGKAMWFAVVVPGLTKSFFFAGEPADLGLDAIETDSVLEVSPYITPGKVVGWAAAPTGA